MIRKYKKDVKKQDFCNEKQLLHNKVQKYYEYFSSLQLQQIEKIDALILNGLCDKDTHVIIFDTLSNQSITKDLWICSKRYKDQNDTFKAQVSENAYKNANAFLTYANELVLLKDEDSLLQFAKTFPKSCLMPKILMSFLYLYKDKPQEVFKIKEFIPYVNLLEKIDLSNYKYIDSLPYYTTDMKLDLFNFRQGYADSDVIFAREFSQYVKNITQKTLNIAEIYRHDETDTVKSVDYIFENLDILEVLKATGYNDRYYKKFFSNPMNDNITALNTLFYFPEYLDKLDYEVILKHIDLNLKRINASNAKKTAEKNKLTEIIQGQQEAITPQEKNRVRVANLKELCNTPSKTTQLSLSDFQ